MSLTTPMKLILALVIIALIGAGFYVVDWQKKYQEIEQLTQELEKSQQKLEKSKEEIKLLPQLTKEVEDLEKELNSLVASKFTTEAPELFVANYIAEIERMVVGQQEATGDYDFQIVSITPGAMTSTTPEGGKASKEDTVTEDVGQTPEALQGFPTRVFQMQMTGRYGTLVDFLYQLGALELDRLVTINKISLQPASGADKASGGAESPVLSVTIPITAYLRQGGG